MYCVCAEIADGLPVSPLSPPPDETNVACKREQIANDITGVCVLCGMHSA